MFSGVGTNGTQSFSETVGVLTLSGGSNAVVTKKTNAASNGLTFAGFGGRALGSTLVFPDNLLGASGGSTVKFTSATGLAPQNGIIGGWAIMASDVALAGGYEFATLNASNNVTALTSYTTNLTTTLPGTAANNVKMTVNQIVTGNQTINSLNIQSSSGRSLTINPGFLLTIASGGIISGTTTHNILGGSMTAGAGSGYDLILHQQVGTLNLRTKVVNNGANEVSLVKSGSGTVVIDPFFSRASNMTQGNTTRDHEWHQYHGGHERGRDGDRREHSRRHHIVQVLSGTQIVLSQAPTGTATGVTLSFRPVNTFTGRTYVNEGILQIAQESDLGANPGAFRADQLTFNGGRLRVISDMTFNDSNRGITIGLAGGNFAVANNKTLVITENNPIQANGKLTFVADASNLGVMLITGNNNFINGIETIGSDLTTTGTLTSTYRVGQHHRDSRPPRPGLKRAPP